MLLCGLMSCVRRNREPGAALISAVLDGDETMVHAALSSHKDVATGTMKLKKSPLHMAAEVGNVAMVSTVVEAMICRESTATSEGVAYIVNSQDSQGQTALFIASAHGHIDCVRYLLANGASRNLPDAHGNTPLHMAAMRGHVQILFMLFDEFVPEGGWAPGTSLDEHVDDANRDGVTALHLAVWCQRTTAVQVLLQHNASLTARTAHSLPEMPPLSRHTSCAPGTSPLHLAAARGHVLICRLLLQSHYERSLELRGPAAARFARQDPRAQANSAGLLPFQVAQRTGYLRLSMMLRPGLLLHRMFDMRDAAHHGPPSLRSLAVQALVQNLRTSAKRLSKLKRIAAGAKAAQRKEEATRASGMRRTLSMPGNLGLPVPGRADQRRLSMSHTAIAAPPASAQRSASSGATTLAMPGAAAPQLQPQLAKSTSEASTQRASVEVEREERMGCGEHCTAADGATGAACSCSECEREDELCGKGVDGGAGTAGGAQASERKVATTSVRGGKRQLDACSVPVTVGGAAVHACKGAKVLRANGQQECGVCLDEGHMLCMAPCRHEICGECALKLCGDTKKAPLCPFCRVSIGGFAMDPIGLPR